MKNEKYKKNPTVLKLFFVFICRSYLKFLFQINNVQSNAYNIVPWFGFFANYGKLLKCILYLYL